MVGPAIAEPASRRPWPGPGAILAPEVAASRCVHSHLEQASCRACVDACPRGAFVLDDERLGVDTGRCDACGVCIPACPQGAVLGTFGPVTYRVGGEPVTVTAFAACAPALGPIGEPGVLPCLHALGLRELLALRCDGVTQLIVSRGDCGRCPRGSATPIDTHLDAARRILASRGVIGLATVCLDPVAWLRAREAAARQPRPGLNRRAFFCHAVGTVVEQVRSRADGEAGSHQVVAGSAPGRWFPTTGPGQLVPFAPEINPARCTGCDTCARLCPEGAIRVEPDAYRLDPDACTGCGVCVDLCTQGAVTVRPLAVPVRTLIPLHCGRCRACGAPFHTPSQDRTGAALCPVCALTQHHRRLFQVLD
ncbi:MAG: 4Fe-4S binding protein [Chromatiaceae bacterium]